MVLTELTDIELARLIMRKLWQWYDDSGVSMGRALRSCLLEAIIALIPCPEMKTEPRLDKLLAEAKRRLDGKQAREERQLLIWLNDISWLDDVSLSYLLLDALVDWYEKDAKTPDPLAREARTVSTVLKLWRPNDQCENLKAKTEREMQKLILEAEDRWRPRSKKEWEEQLWFEEQQP